MKGHRERIESERRKEGRERERGREEGMKEEKDWKTLIGH